MEEAYKIDIESYNVNRPNLEINFSAEISFVNFS